MKKKKIAGNIIKVRNNFRLKKEIDDTIKKEDEAIKDKIVRSIRNLFELENEKIIDPNQITTA